MYICFFFTYIHTHLHTYKHVYLHTYMCTHKDVCMNTCIYTCTYLCDSVHVNVYMDVQKTKNKTTNYKTKSVWAFWDCVIYTYFSDEWIPTPKCEALQLIYADMRAKTSLPPSLNLSPPFSFVFFFTVQVDVDPGFDSVVGWVIGCGTSPKNRDHPDPTCGLCSSAPNNTNVQKKCELPHRTWEQRARTPAHCVAGLHCALLFEYLPQSICNHVQTVCTRGQLSRLNAWTPKQSKPQACQMRMRKLLHIPWWMMRPSPNVIAARALVAMAQNRWPAGREGGSCFGVVVSE